MANRASASQHAIAMAKACGPPMTAIGLLEAGEIASLAHLVDAHGDRCGSGLCCGCGGSTAVWRVQVPVPVWRIAVRQNQGEG